MPTIGLKVVDNDQMLIIGGKAFDSQQDLIDFMTSTGEFANQTTYIINNVRKLSDQEITGINSVIGERLDGDGLLTDDPEGTHPIVLKIWNGAGSEELMTRAYPFKIIKHAAAWIDPDQKRVIDRERLTKPQVIEWLLEKAFLLPGAPRIDEGGEGILPLVESEGGSDNLPVSAKEDEVNKPVKKTTTKRKPTAKK